MEALLKPVYSATIVPITTAETITNSANIKPLLFFFIYPPSFILAFIVNILYNIFRINTSVL